MPGLVNPVVLLSRIDAMPVGCAVGGYRAKAAAAQAGGERSVSFNAGLPAGVVSVIGQDGPPHRGARRARRHADRAEGQRAGQDGKAFAFQAVAKRLTWFAIKAPKPGVWKIVPEADSMPIVGVPRPRARPRRRRRPSARAARAEEHLVLQDHAASRPEGHVHRGREGDGAPLGKATRAAQGALAFTPTSGAGGTRKIVATVTEGHAARRADRRALRRAGPGPARQAAGDPQARGHQAHRPLAPRPAHQALRAARQADRRTRPAPAAQEAAGDDRGGREDDDRGVTVRGIDAAGVAGPQARAVSRGKARKAAARSGVWAAG